MSVSKIAIKTRFSLNQKQTVTIPSSALLLKTNDSTPSPQKKKNSGILFIYTFVFYLMKSANISYIIYFFLAELFQNVIPHYKIAKKIVTPANVNIKSNTEKSEKLVIHSKKKRNTIILI